MKIVTSTQALKSELSGLRRAMPGGVGFVPTMGALHEGHASLIRRARRECAYVVVSIFVNPLQFGPREDFSRYPRTLKKDAAMCRRAGADLIFAPSADDILSKGAVPPVRLPQFTKALCGPFRPGHFQGVARIVSRLFKLVKPQAAYFGQKDYQQSLLIEWLAQKKFGGRIRIAVCPTVREKDGLAMSSRNCFLSTVERRRATTLYRALRWGRGRLRAGDAPRAIERMMAEKAMRAGFKVDYLSVADAKSLKKVVKSTPLPKSGAVLAGAVRLGGTRLIDNIRVS